MNETEKINNLWYQAMKTGKGKDHRNLYQFLKIIASELLPKFLKHRTQDYNQEEKEQFIHDSVTRLYVRMMTKEGYKISYIRPILYKEIQHRIDTVDESGSDKKFQLYNLQIDNAITEDNNAALIDKTESKRQINHRYSIETILEHTQGVKVLYDLYGARSYKAAILQISEYIPRAWIYDNVLHLSAVYRYTRRDPRTNKRRVIKECVYKNQSALIRLFGRMSKPSSKTIRVSDLEMC